jgi:cytoplasmic iron level regulating protein YaaA (DUF328/UPF0246 family)
MILLLSPAKKMRVLSGYDGTQPLFEQEAVSLAHILRSKSIDEISEMMRVSEKLAKQVHQSYSEFPGNLTPALFAYAGAVFSQILPGELSESQLEFAQDHVFILSGLYGLLRPMDLISSYRLEMAQAMRLESAASLYAFWKPRITGVLEKSPDQQFINLASSEYSRAVDFSRLAQVVTITFKTDSPKGPRTIGMYAKQARGNMVSQILRGGVDNPERLKELEVLGHRYREELSCPSEWVFLRRKSVS